MESLDGTGARDASEINTWEDSRELESSLHSKATTYPVGKWRASRVLSLNLVQGPLCKLTSSSSFRLDNKSDNKGSTSLSV